MSSLQGINGTVFMYGQTGAGKTFSMLGSHKYNQQMDENDKSNNSNNALNVSGNNKSDNKSANKSNTKQKSPFTK